MPERPLILFADPIPAERARRGGGPPRFNRPSRERQVERLMPQFSSLQKLTLNIHLYLKQQGILPAFTQH